MKKMIGIFICIILIGTIIPVGINATDICEKNVMSQETFIDPSLYLSKNHIPVLKNAFGCYDKDLDLLLIEIISSIEEEGSVNNTEFGEIIDTLNLNITAVYFSHIVFCTDFDQNNFHFLPGKMFMNNRGSYFGPALFLTVKNTNHFYVWRLIGLQNTSFNPFYEDVDVVGIGFIGMISDRGSPLSDYGWNFLGLGLLWIVFE